MDFDNEIRNKIRMDMPKLILYDGPEFEGLKKQYLGQMYNQKDIFVKCLDVQLQYEDTDELFANNSTTRRMMVFFLNYLQNENLLKGEDLSKKLFFGLINIKKFDENGDLEYDNMEQFQQDIFLPNYINEAYEEVILMISDLGRWCGLYLDKKQQIGQFFDFKDPGKVEITENLEVLNEIIKAEYGFDVTNFDIRVMQSNINIDTDGAYFIINLLYKLVQGVSLEKLDFSAKERSILKERLDWLVLKTKDVQSSNTNTKKSKGKKSQMNDSEDIILDEGMKQRKPTMAPITQKSNNTISSKKIQYQDNDDSQNDSMLVPQLDKRGQRKPTVFMNKGRQKTKIISVHQPQQPESYADKTDLYESFDYRGQSDQQLQSKRHLQDIKEVSYQESVHDDLGEMWNFTKQPQKSKVPLKKYDKNENELNNLWDFKAQYKKGLRSKFNQPVLIPEEHKELYRYRNDQNSQQRDFQDKVIDIIAFLDSPNNQDIVGNPVIQQAVDRLRQQLGLKSRKDISDTDGEEGNDQSGSKTNVKDIGQLKKIIKQRMIENATGNLDKLLEKQKILNDILDYDVEEKKDLERRFENEIKKIDTRFQDYMQRYDAMNQYESLQSMYKNAYHAPPDYEIAQMKDSMHLELQNYLLSGLGLSSKFSSNPVFSQQQDGQSHSIQNGKFNVSNPPKKNNSKSNIPQFNQSYVNQNNSDNKQSLFKNNSMISLNNQNGQYIGKNSSESNNRKNNYQPENQNPDMIARRYNCIITKKSLVDALTQDRLDDNLITFLLGYLEEKFYHENSRDVMIREENRILIYPVQFYSELTQNSPLIKQQQLNLNEVAKYTKSYMNRHTIFDEFDKLIFPIMIAKPQLYSLVVADINVRQIIYFPIMKNLQLKDDKSNSNLSAEQSLNNSEISYIQENPMKNPISLNILKYLEKEFSNKCMKNFNILNWNIQNMNCTQTSSPSLSAYYMILYITMILNQNYLFNTASKEHVKKLKTWIPEVLKTVGVTNNQIGEINYFVSMQ